MRLWVPILLLMLLAIVVWLVLRGLIDFVAWFKEEILEDVSGQPLSKPRVETPTGDSAHQEPER